MCSYVFYIPSERALRAPKLRHMASLPRTDWGTADSKWILFNLTAKDTGTYYHAHMDWTELAACASRMGTELVERVEGETMSSVESNMASLQMVLDDPVLGLCANMLQPWHLYVMN